MYNMYNKNLNKMNKEQLRMQMLSGIITENQYKAKLNEYGMTSLEDEDTQDVKDIISLLKQAADKCDNVEMEDLAFNLREYANEVEQTLNSML